MDITIPATFERFVQEAVQSGRFGTPGEVVAEALRLLERRERLRRDVQAGVDQLDQGHYTEYGQDSLPTFQEDISLEERRRFGSRAEDP